MTVQEFNDALKNIKDEETFKVFYDTFYVQIIKICIYFRSSYHDAQDVAIEIFHYILTHEYHYVKNPKAWLFALCRYNCQKFYKKETSLNPVVENQYAIKTFVSPELRDALSSLPEKDAEFILLHWFYGYSLDEMAHHVHKTYLATAKYHERIKKRLKELLQK